MYPTTHVQPTLTTPDAVVPSAAASLSLARYRAVASGGEASSSLPPEQFPPSAAEARRDANALLAFGVALPCQRPIVVRRTDPDGTMRDVRIRCGNRRAAACPSCSALYRGDVKRLFRAGLDALAETGETLIFLTLTAPSFGAVHWVPPTPPPRLGAAQRRRWAASHRRRCRCGVYHAVADEAVKGVPVDASAYEYERQTQWNSLAPRLWSRTGDRLARLLGRDPATGHLRRPPYVAVAEFQARGAVHFHVLLRVPAGVDLDVYDDAARGRRAGRIERLVREVETFHEGRRFTWGTQVVADVLRDSDSRRRSAGYLAKLLSYTTKDLARGVDGREHSRERSRHDGWLDVCAEEQVACGPRCDGLGRCTRPGHRSRGFGGHVMRRSRSWSGVSLGSLRAARRRWACAVAGASASSDPDVTWMFVRQERESAWPCARARAARLRDHGDALEFFDVLGVT